MSRHRTDLLSLVSGLVFIGAAIAAWNGVLRLDGLLDLRWVWPVLLIAGGLALLAGVTRRDGAPAGDTDPSSDADDVTAGDAGWESPPAGR